MNHLAASFFTLCMVTTLAARTATAATPAPPQRLFYSGHSLLDEPLPRDVASIAASLGTPLLWRRQHLEGSSIRERNQQDPQAAWTDQGGPYDTLVVTEQHTLVGNLVWNDTVGQLRHLHDRFIEASPRGQTWFYASWLNVDSLDDPRRWIAYERAASPVWQCIATAINASLAAEGRRERIAFVPAGLLLASLVEGATQGGGVDGVSAGSTRATLGRLFRDDVHLTPLGSYFMSLLVYASLFDRSPAGAAIPDGIDAPAASALQRLAWDLVQQERRQRETLPLDACRSRLQGFVAPYAAYVRDAIDRPRLGAWRAWWSWAKHRLQWQWALRRSAGTHPLRFAPREEKKASLRPP